MNLIEKSIMMRRSNRDRLNLIKKQDETIARFRKGEKL
jgi:hypothetical protein